MPPMRLPLPSSSTKRYQYSRAAGRLPTMTRQVQSEAAETVAAVVAMTFLKSGS
jgi:hypothetical protein